jgi:hypothetical protein
MNRREVLASVGAASLLPAVAAFAEPAAERGHSVFGATLRLGPSQAGAGNHRWAPILGGEAASGRVLAGRLDWQVDPASGAVEAAVACTLVSKQGQAVEMCRGGLLAVRLPDGSVQLSTHNAA